MVGRRFALVPLAAIALLAAACSSSGGATPSPTAAPTVAAPPSAAASQPAAASEEPSASSSEAAGDSYPLAVATVAAGKTLTGEDGKTLYIFKADTKDSGKSTCNGDCATNWPPYELEAGEKLEQAAEATGKITMITRDDGSQQVAYNGWPVYYFAGDKAAGDSNGQGLAGGKWVIAAP